MKIDIRDVATMATLRPLEVASYLRTSGWQQVEFREGQYAVWTRGEAFEVLLPLRATLSDFALRMGDLLGTVSHAEERSQMEVLSDLLVTGSDVLRVRITDDDLADGSMPIDEYTQTAQKVRDIMLAGACSAIERRPVWHRRKPDRAVEYLRSVRVGQTERGSYVLSVISQVPPLLQSSERNGGVESADPYERKVTRGLADALQAVEQAAEISAASGSLDGFEAGVQRGVSANLCEAVAGLSSAGDDSGRSVEFAFSWSRSRPVPEDQISRIFVAADRAPFVGEAARVLRERSPIENFKLEGNVVKLERPETAIPGLVTVYAIIEGAAKRVRVELAEAEYKQAVAAHLRGLTIRCSGRLIRAGGGFQLKEPVAFSVRGETE